MSSLSDLLDSDTLFDLAGARYFQRGDRYVEEGRVGPIRESEFAIEGIVEGERTYGVRIWIEGSRIVAACSCPVGETGAFCKHCVALALSWLRRPGAGSPLLALGRPQVRAAVEPVDSIRPFLESLDRDALVELVGVEAGRDTALSERLRLRAAMAAPGRVGLAALTRSLDRATSVRGDLRYGDVRSFAQGVHGIADLLDHLVTAHQPDVAIGLAERALERLERALEQADDSDGLIGDLLARLQELHLEACRAARPDSVKLAERLFRWELDGDWDVLRGAAERYADVLGDEGLATYRRLAEAEWARIPALGPRDEDTADEDGDRFNVAYMMGSLARAFQDVDMEIAVRSRDLSSAYDFLAIAQLCRDAGRGGDALIWAERGARAFPTRTDVRLRQFLADEYLSQSRGDDAMAPIWAAFSEGPGLDAYKLLKEYADRIGGWTTWRLRALDEVRSSIDQAMAAVPARGQPLRYRWQEPPDGSRLVEISRWEGNLDAAWAEARRLGCSRGLWLQLASESEETRPEDALFVYRQEVDALHQVTDKRVYAQSVDILRRIGALMARLDRTPEFVTYAAGVRAANARRPTFLALVDAAQLAEQRPALRVVREARSRRRVFRPDVELE